MSQHNLTPLTRKLNELSNHGFDKEFFIKDSLLQSFNENRRYTKDEVTLLDEMRFEGDTDPGDSSILYLLQTKEGHMGTLVNSYGANSNPEVDQFIKAIKRK